MEQAFLATTGTLADRLLAALAAGDVTGGQKTGRESAALLVRTPDGFPLDIDLRVDHSDNPVAELQKLYDIQSARQQVIAAEIAARRGQRENARTLMIAAVARAQWPRVLIRAAKLAEQLEERPLALQYIEMAFSRNPAWAQQEIGSGDYAELGAAPAFHRWITADQEQRAIAASRETSGNKTSSLEDCLSAARILLEAGHPGEARDLLDQTAARFPQTSALRLTRAEAYAATGDYGKALKECQEAQAQDPNNWRIRLRIGRLREQMTTPESNK
jgi:tetratricopeptide (TPR) repeat protein